MSDAQARHTAVHLGDELLVQLGSHPGHPNRLMARYVSLWTILHSGYHYLHHREHCLRDDQVLATRYDVLSHL